MIVWLKFVHIAAIAVWCGGLISIPWLHVQRRRAGEGQDLYRLQALVRFAYVALVSPAAFVAVASGIALVFAASTFELWFALKLAMVGVLVVIHVLTGLVVIRLFERGQDYPAWRYVVVTGLTVATISSILAVVLAKPILGLDFLPDFFSRPGALGEWGGDLIDGVTR